MTNHPHLVEDSWLSERLGRPAFHLIGDMDQVSRYRDDIAEALSAPVFADAKVPVNQISQIAPLQNLGFVLIDTQLTFSLTDRSSLELRTGQSEFAGPDMAKAIGGLAERSFTCDRFHRDPEIPNSAAAEIKRCWAENFFTGRRGDWMIISRRQNEPVGFLQLLRSPRGELVIDLIAVDHRFQRQGIAREMISFAAHRCGVPGPMVVGTQAANVASVRLYESLGFRLEGAHYVFHLHRRSS